MTNHFDDDSFWDEPAGEATSQIRRIEHRAPERTRTHHVVARDAAPPPLDRDGETLWVEPRTPSNDRLGVFGSVDPRLLSVGALAIAAVLAVPLFGAFSGNDGNDGGFRSVAEARATTTTEAPTTTAPSTPVAPSAEIVVTAALNPESADAPQPGIGDSGSGGDESESDPSSAGPAATGGTAARAVLRTPTGCSNTYEAVAGDYWLGIADSADVSLDDLLATNDASAETAIFPGNDVCLPDGATVGGSVGVRSAGGGSTTGGTTAVTEPAPCVNVYEPVAGDYWLRIAEASGASLDDLLAKNAATADTPLYPGAAICLPAGASAPTPSTATPSTEAPTTPPPATQPATTEAPMTAPPTTDATTTAPTTEAPAVTTPAPPPPSGGEVEQMIRDVWPDELEEQALRIAWRESNYRPDVTSSTGCCVGVFQMHWEAHRGWLDEVGVTSRDQLFDARTNIEAAYALYRRSGGWGPWALTAG